MTILNVLILSIIEGLTEFLPISSTGHLIIAQHLLQIPTSEFTKSFEIIIQLAAISAVTFKFRNEIISSKKHWGKIATAFIPTGVIGFVLYKLIKHYLLGNILVTIVSLLLGGIAIYLFEKNYKSSNYNKKIDDLNTKDLVTIGLFQSLSVIPGVSRSASSIIGGLSSGLKREESVMFSFFLAIPTMMAATFYDLVKSSINFTSSEKYLITIGCITAFLSSIVAINFFLKYVSQNNLKNFAYYRIITAIVIWGIFYLRF